MVRTVVWVNILRGGMFDSLCRVHCGCLLLQVLPGGRIPADGQLVVGSSYINEAMITGESQPVLKRKGDALIGGTINTGKSWPPHACTVAAVY
jgi:P-type E1-E2 ATPase